jgi:HEAT repeat protein
MSDNSLFTGREPRLSSSYTQHGKRSLTTGRLAQMLEVLPPNMVSLDVAAEALRNESFYVRYAAARLLNKRGDRAARMVMQKILSEDNVRSRASVARYLYGFSWFAIEPLIQQALGDTDARVREGAMYALCDMRELNAFELMTHVLQNEVDSVREAAAWGLRECQDPAAIPVLEAVLLADDPEVRVKALEVLGTNGMTKAIPVIHRSLSDSDTDVQYAATLSLLEVAGEGCLEELAAVIRHSSGWTRQAILKGFFHATNYLKINIEAHQACEAIIDALEASVSDELSQAREAAIWPLAWIRHPRTPVILCDAYSRETNVDVQAQIVRIFSSLMSEAEADILQSALHSQHDKVRAEAEQIMASRKQMAQP